MSGYTVTEIQTTNQLNTTSVFMYSIVFQLYKMDKKNCQDSYIVTPQWPCRVYLSPLPFSPKSVNTFMQSNRGRHFHTGFLT